MLALQEAENLMIEDDYATAKEKLLKLKQRYQLYPKTEIITSMLTVCEILSAAKLKLPGCGIDYYWVLEAMPSSTLSSVSAHHKKILASLQPFKGKFYGIELALELVDEAFSVLSDTQKRSKYDLERNASMEGSQGSGVVNTTTYEVMSNISESITFLEEPFSLMEGFDQKVPSQDYYNFENERKFEHFEAGQIWAVQFRTSLYQNYRYALVLINSNEKVCVTWLKPIPVSARERRWCDAGLPVACGSFDLGLEQTWSRYSYYSYKCSRIWGVVEDQFEIYPKKGEIWALYRDWDIDEWAYSCDCVKQRKFELVKITSDFSKDTGGYCEYLVKVDGFRYIFERKTIGGNPVTLHIYPDMFYMFSHKIPAYRFKGGEIDKVLEGMVELGRLALPDGMINDVDTRKKPETENLSSFSCDSPIGLISHKPCPDDYFLKPHWSAKDFARGQIWTVYCGKDFMPRQYTRIENVISESEVYVTFLEPLAVLDSEFEWRKEKPPIVCGVFKVSTTRSSINIGISEFAHLIKCQQIAETLYEIQPLKGEIWAMYKNWNNKRQYDYEAYQCQVVQILSDISERDGIRIARLEEVEGYLTFFRKQQQDGFDLTCVVSNAEMLSFSHRIPVFRVPGIGRHGIPESAWHLEPNALPPKRGDQFQVKPHDI